MSLVKEIILSLVSCLVVLIALSIGFYRFIPNNKVIPETVSYQASEEIKNDNQMEFWSLREVVLNFGRIISYILLLMVSLIKSGKYLNILMLFLTLSILLMGISLSKISKNDK